MHGIGLSGMRAVRAKSIPPLALCALALILHSSFFPPHSSAQGVITTVAGNGRVLRGDGGPATAAALGEIWGVALDSAGNVFASDGSNNQVVKISPAGILTVVAGNGLQGFSGDGGPATSASLNRPRGLAVDASGNLYIADQDNNRIRRVSPSGVISTAAGNGEYGFSGDGGPAARASFRSPRGVALDAAGNLYIADLNSHRVRKIDPAGTIITVAGNGVAGFAGDGGQATAASLLGPWGVALDGSGNLYIAEAGGNRVRKVSPGAIISTVAGNGVEGFAGDGGQATRASLWSPRGMGVDGRGNLFIADIYNHRIRKVSPDGIISTVAGGNFGFSGDGGAAIGAAFHFPEAVAVDAAGQLYIADSGNGRVRKVGSDGTISTIAGVGLVNFSGDGGSATSASLSQPIGVAVDAAGNLYIADSSNHRIRRVSPTGIISTVAGTGVAGFSGDGGPALSALLNQPQGVAVDASGNVYFAGGQRVRKISSAGIISTVAGNGSYAFSGDGGPATNASFRDPQRLALDATGNLYIADTGNHRVRKIGPTGIINTVAGNGAPSFAGDGGAATNASLQQPLGIHVDAAGNLYIADFGNNRIRKVTSGGMISTIAGGGVLGVGGHQRRSSWSDGCGVRYGRELLHQ